MERVLCGLAALPLLAGAALAQPTVQLSDAQMDRVTAGFEIDEIDVSNTSVTIVKAYLTPNTITLRACAGCYLLIESPALSVGSVMLGSPVILP